MKTKAVLRFGYDRYLLDLDVAVKVAEMLANATVLLTDYGSSCGYKLAEHTHDRPTVEVLSVAELAELELGRD